jgi:RNA 3'-terminal phosphate cyclase (ATP)
MDEMAIWIDGAYGEGGGQIIRTSVTLAALTGKPLEIANIRARRSKPGLQAQHLTSVRAAARLCGALLTGDELGSQWLRFVPGAAPTTATEFVFDVGEARGGASAGATGLVAQTALLPLAHLWRESTTLIIKGGTHVPMSPAADYIEAVYLPMLARLGVHAGLSAARVGFFPKGGGEVRLEIEPTGELQGMECVERGRLKRLKVFIVTAELPEHVAARGRESLLKALKGYGVPVEFELRNLKSNGAGAAIILTAECATGMGGWTALGERGKPMERVAEEALRGFQRWYAGVGATDEHLADQLALPCALIPTESRWTTSEATQHLHTVLWVIRQFLPIEYALEPYADGSILVRLRGVNPPISKA